MRHCEPVTDVTGVAIHIPKGREKDKKALACCGKMGYNIKALPMKGGGKENRSGCSAAGSAGGLGPSGRRFEPCHSDQNQGRPRQGLPLILLWATGRQSLLAHSAAAATDDAQRHPSPFREFEPCHSDHEGTLIMIRSGSLFIYGISCMKSSWRKIHIDKFL